MNATKKIIGLLPLLTLALILGACTTSAEDTEMVEPETGYVDIATPDATIDADNAMFTVTEEEAIEMALEAVPGELFNVTTSEIIENDLHLYTWHVIIDTPEDGRVVVEIVKASGEMNILPLRR